MPIDADAFLEHHGIKGMHWGVRKERPIGSGRKASSSTKPATKTKFSPLEKQVLSHAEKAGMTNDRMKAMFGPEPTTAKKQKFTFTPKEKVALKRALEIGVAGGAIYGLHRLGENALLTAQLGEYKNSDHLVSFWKDYQKSAKKTAFTAKEIEHFSTEGISLPSGSIVKRISTEAETTIRPGGFFAAYKEEDVNRYKAVLPVYWKQWGPPYSNAVGGYVNHYEAKEAIKAPSQKETFDLFAEFLDKKTGQGRQKYRDQLGDVLGLGVSSTSSKVPAKELARQTFRNASLYWADNSNILTKGFFEHVKSKGFNALVDYNDAGHLADQPLRLLDGSIFKIAKNESLTPGLIRSAQEALVKVAHAFNAMVKTFLAHGIKPNVAFR